MSWPPKKYLEKFDREIGGELDGVKKQTTLFDISPEYE